MCLTRTEDLCEDRERLKEAGAMIVRTVESRVTLDEKVQKFSWQS